MGKVTTSILINAPQQTVFDLARSMKAHAESTGSNRERIVSGSKHDLLELGDEVTFEAIHLGIKQRLTSKIVEMDSPRYFIDEMQRGAFKRLRHIHRFDAKDGQTLMGDELDFESPFSILRRIVDWLVLERYMKRFILAKSEEPKRLAEGMRPGVRRDPLIRP